MSLGFESYFWSNDADGGSMAGEGGYG